MSDALRRCRGCGRLNNRHVNNVRCYHCGREWSTQLRVLNTTVAPANGVEVSR